MFLTSDQAMTETCNDMPVWNGSISRQLPQRLIQQNQLTDYNVTSFIQLILNHFLQQRTNTTLIMHRLKNTTTSQWYMHTFKITLGFVFQATAGIRS